MDRHYPLLLATCFLVVACRQMESPPERPNGYYTEAHRPQFHFSPESRWMNDPNGLVFYEGEYHLFYQYYPDSTVWGPMHWGHAVSADLVHWEHLPIALYPDSLGYIFSGSAVVDSSNTSGFGQNGKAPLVAMFTYHDMPGEKSGGKNFQYQAIAYSNDKGRTWTKYEGNPVIPNPGDAVDFRDPKVFWYAPDGKWVMVLAESTHIGIYTSPDLKSWTKTSEFGRQEGWHGDAKSDWECPDLFELNVQERDERKWVLLVSVNPGAFNGGSGTQYFTGHFDGETFVSEDPPQTVHWLDLGWDNYAGVTWGNAPVRSPEERIFIGWMSNWLYGQQVPTHPWRSAMTVPRVLSLRQTAQGLRLFQVPVSELQALRKSEASLPATQIAGELELSNAVPIAPPLMEAELEFDLSASDAEEFGVVFSNSSGELYRIGYVALTGELFSDRRRSGKVDFSPVFADSRHVAPLPAGEQSLKMHFLLDRASCELFVNDGERTMTEVFFPKEDFSVIKLYSQGGTAALRSARFWELGSIWGESSEQ